MFNIFKKKSLYFWKKTPLVVGFFGLVKDSEQVLIRHKKTPQTVRTEETTRKGRKHTFTCRLLLMEKSYTYNALT